MKLCRHCQRKRVNRPLGLCWSCYYTPGVRDLYRPRQEPKNFYGPAAPPVPTLAMPGSEEKFAVLVGRAAARQALFHPLDARRED